MPPLKVEVIVNEKSIRLPDVPAGASVSMTDYDPTGESVLLVSCGLFDNGGSVQRQSLEKTAANRIIRIVDADRLAPVSKIETHATVDVPFHVKAGKATLSITHFNN